MNDGNMERREKLFGTFLIFLITAVIVLIIFLMFRYLFPGLLPLVRAGDEKGIAAYLNKEGAWKGLACSFLLCILQVMSVVIPCVPIHVATGLIYGLWTAWIVCYLGFIAGNVIVFTAARRLGRHISRLIPLPQKSNWLTQKINSAHPAVVIALACMIPAVPNGIIPYIAARSVLSTRGLAIAVAATSWLQVLTNCACGFFIIRGQIGMAVLVFVLQLLLIGVIAWKREPILGKLK